MIDLSTAEDIEISGYVVKYAKSETGEWHAVVTKHSGVLGTVPVAIDPPTVIADGKYEAIGSAIDAYERAKDKPNGDNEQ